MSSEYVYDPREDVYGIYGQDLCDAAWCDEYADLERCAECRHTFCPDHIIQRHGLGTNEKADVCLDCIRRMVADLEYLEALPEPITEAA